MTAADAEQTSCTDIINSLYTEALQLGITCAEFWDMSIPELLDTINARENQKAHDFKEQISIVFANAEATASRVAFVFTDPKKRNKKNIVMPWDLYPQLFSEEHAAEQQINDEMALQKHKADMAAFAARWNKRKQEQQQNDGEASEQVQEAEQ